MVTSCHAAEGKTFLTMNTMRMLAKFGKNVALVDADLRRSMISAKYTLQFDAPEEKYGLSHMLAGMVEEDQVLYQTNIPGAYMVPVGREVSNPLPLLNSPRFAHLLNYLHSGWIMCWWMHRLWARSLTQRRSPRIVMAR